MSELNNAHNSWFELLKYFFHLTIGKIFKPASLQNLCALSWIALRLIPDATHRKPACLIVVVTVHIATVVSQVAVVRTWSWIPRSTPPEAVGASGVVSPIGVTEATGKTCKAATIGGACVRTYPMCYSYFFHCSSSNCTLGAKITSSICTRVDCFN